MSALALLTPETPIAGVRFNVRALRIRRRIDMGIAPRGKSTRRMRSSVGSRTASR
jgi:hypothetical protein